MVDGTGEGAGVAGIVAVGVGNGVGVGKADIVAATAAEMVDLKSAVGVGTVVGVKVGTGGRVNSAAGVLVWVGIGMDVESGEVGVKRTPQPAARLPHAISATTGRTGHNLDVRSLMASLLYVS